VFRHTVLCRAANFQSSLPKYRSLPSIQDRINHSGGPHYADDAKLYNTISSREDQICLQQVINRIKEWCDKWLLRLNTNKCKTVSYCLKNRITTEYFINDGWIGHKIEQVAQLSQRDRAAGWVSYGQKWKTGTGRQYLRTI